LKHFSISAPSDHRIRTAGSWITLALALCFANGVYAQIPDMPVPQVETAGSTLEGIQKRIDAGEFKQAASDLDSFLKSDQNSSKAHAMLAYCLLRMDDPKGSLTEYTRSAALAHPDSTDLQNVAKDYALLNDLPDADHWMTLAVKMDPKNAEAWYGLGRIRYTQQRF